MVKIQDIRNLHSEYSSSGEPTCSECGAAFPCNTIKLCDGDLELQNSPTASKAERITTLIESRNTYLAYLFIKIVEEDWHGVQDAASDLRDIDSKIKGLEFK